MTNAELKRIGKMLDNHLAKVRELVNRIEHSGREDKDLIILALDKNQIPIYVSADYILSEYYKK